MSEARFGEPLRRKDIQLWVRRADNGYVLPGDKSLETRAIECINAFAGHDDPARDMKKLVKLATIALPYIHTDTFDFEQENIHKELQAILAKFKRVGV